KLAAEAAPTRPSMAAIFVVEALVERLDLHLVAGLLRQARGQPVGGAGDLVAQLEVVRQPLRVQGAGLDRGAHRAAGFAVVAAVAEPALFGQRLDVGETALGQVLLAGGLEFAHAGGVDQAGTRRQRDQRAVGGGVAAARVALAHAGGLHLLDAEQGVGQRGLAGAGAADQHRGHAGLQPRAEHADAAAVPGVDRERGHVAGNARERVDGGPRVAAVAVGLGQHDDRLRAAAVHQQQVALDPARIEVTVQAAYHQHGVDVGGDDLLPVVLAGRPALDRGAARQEGDDAVAVEQYPVTDRRALVLRRASPAVAGRALPFGRGFDREALPGAVGDEVAGAVLFDHPRRPRPRMRGHRLA